MKRILAWFLALIMVFGMVSLPKMTKAEGEEVSDQPESVDEIVNDAEGEPKAPGTKDGQYWDIGSFILAVGDTTHLETTLTGAVWGSDDETVVTVDENHVVTARSVGHAYIWAYGTDEELGFDVTHQWEITVTQLTLSTDALELPLGGSGALTASYHCIDNLYNVISVDVTDACTWSWTDNDPEIASFDKTTGTITAGNEQGGTAALSASYTPEGLNHPLLASCTVTVNNDPLPTITVQPKDVTVKSGVKAKFAVKVKEKNVRYQWYTLAAETDEWAAVNGETKAELNVIGTKGNMNSQYRCLVSAVEGGAIYTDIATLTVILQPPVIRVQPKDITVKSGTTAKIRVSASGRGLTYLWFTRSSETDPWTEIPGATNAKYSFATSKSDSGRQYYCRVENADGFVDSAIATLTVTPQPAAIKAQPKSITVKSGAKVKLSVRVIGPNLSYQWYERPSAEADWAEIQGAAKADYSFTATLAQDGTQFYCKVWSDGEPLTSDTATLTVTSQPIVIKTNPKDMAVKSGAKASFVVLASGPNLRYQWFVRTSEDAEWESINGATKRYYAVKASDANNGWQFYCLVYNADGHESSSIVTLTLK